jgi:chromatin remodeling complex protein RSC6
MAKQTKSKTDQTQVSTPASETVAPVEVKTKAPRAKKIAPVTASDPVQTPSTATTATTTSTTPSDEVSTDVAEHTELASQSSDFLAKLNKWVSEGNALKAEFKALEKRWTRELKNAQKSKKRTKRGGNRSPSGFVKPTKISDELAKFLEKPLGSEMARTEVTKEINNYIRAHSLQDKDNGRKIIPDSKLAGLLKISPSDELTYFNLQKYMSPHFPKVVKVPVDAA